MSVTIRELVIADPPEAWRAAGFLVPDDGCCRVGPVLLRLVGHEVGREIAPAERGVVRWVLTGVPAEGQELDDLDGIATEIAPEPTDEPRSDVHPNGAHTIDHLVVLTPHLQRTVDVLAEIGLEPRRRRDGELHGSAVRQVFYRLGPTILEVVGDPSAAGEGPAQLWGITFAVADIDATATLLEEGIGAIRPAVQPGRRIGTLRHRSFDITMNTAFLSDREER